LLGCSWHSEQFFCFKNDPQLCNIEQCCTEFFLAAGGDIDGAVGPLSLLTVDDRDLNSGGDDVDAEGKEVEGRTAVDEEVDPLPPLPLLAANASSVTNESSSQRKFSNEIHL
jgi:hypothetical protein